MSFTLGNVDRACRLRLTALAILQRAFSKADHDARGACSTPQLLAPNPPSLATDMDSPRKPGVGSMVRPLLGAAAMRSSYYWAALGLVVSVVPLAGACSALGSGLGDGSGVNETGVTDCQG